MNAEQLTQYLLRLGVAWPEAAQLLSVSPRTVRRWLEGEDIPSPAQNAIKAWIRLHERHLPWRPDSESVVTNDQHQISLHRQLAAELADILKRVGERGGAKTPWSVDWERGRAEMGPIHVTFYKLLNGGFSLGSYRRSDINPDTVRDSELIEDAVWAIANALKRKNLDYGPVKLVLHERRPKSWAGQYHLEEFQTIDAAIRRLCLDGGLAKQEPFIMTASPCEVLWDKHELQRECARRAYTPKALIDLERDIRKHSTIFVQNGARMLSAADAARRRGRIEGLADDILKLSERAADGKVSYQHFEEVLGGLHTAGFFPSNEIVSKVASALEGIRPVN